MLLLATVLMCSNAMEEFAPEDVTLRNIILIDQHILVGSSSSLYRLNPNTLMDEVTMPLTSENRLLVADSGGSFDGNFLSCDSNRCFLAEISNFNNVSWQVDSSSPLIRDGTMNLHGLFVPSLGGTSELIFVETANGEVGRRVVRGGLANVMFSPSRTTPPQDSEFLLLADRVESRVVDPTTYYTQFTHNGFVYFVHDPIPFESFIRVLRFCQNDSGVAEGPQRNFVSHVEIKLGCGSLMDCLHLLTL